MFFLAVCCRNDWLLDALYPSALKWDLFCRRHAQFFQRNNNLLPRRQTRKQQKVRMTELKWNLGPEFLRKTNKLQQLHAPPPKESSGWYFNPFSSLNCAAKIRTPISLTHTRTRTHTPTHTHLHTHTHTHDFTANKFNGASLSWHLLPHSVVSHTLILHPFHTHPILLPSQLSPLSHSSCYRVLSCLHVCVLCKWGERGLYFKTCWADRRWESRG